MERRLFGHRLLRRNLWVRLAPMEATISPVAHSSSYDYEYQQENSPNCKTDNSSSFYSRAEHELQVDGKSDKDDAQATHQISLSCIFSIMNQQLMQGDESNSILDSQQPTTLNKSQTYFSLIEKVGSSGRYQFRQLIVLCLCWFSSAIILLSPAFLFRVRNLSCQAHGLAIPSKECNTYVCTLSQNLWTNYLPSVNFDSISIINDKDLCDRSVIIDLVSSSGYFGSLVGYLIYSYFMDNYGRRRSFLIVWSICTVGTAMICFSQGNLILVAIGLFLSGGSCNSCVSLSIVFISQTTSQSKTPKYIAYLNLFWCLGGLFLTLIFYLIRNWPIDWIILALMTNVAVLVLCFAYLKETPQFLIKQGTEKAVRVLNEIGTINLSREDCISEHDIQMVLCEISNNEVAEKSVNIVDLFRYQSLRQTTLTLLVLSILLFTLFYGPPLIIGQFGFNIYATSLAVELAGVFNAFFGTLAIGRLKRKTILIQILILCIFCSLAMVLIKKPEECFICWQSILQLVFIFIFKLGIGFFVLVFNIFVSELYPTRVRALGTCMAYTGGTIGSTVSPIYLGYLRRKGINVFNFFVIFSLIAIASVTFLRQTHGVPMKQQIQELERKWSKNDLVNEQK